VDIVVFIDRHDSAWSEHDLEAIISVHKSDMVFEKLTRGVRAEAAAGAARIHIR
jgi:hypothetical protein